MPAGIPAGLESGMYCSNTPARPTGMYRMSFGSSPSQSLKIRLEQWSNGAMVQEGSGLQRKQGAYR